MFMLHQTSVKMAVLLHKQANDRFHPLLTVLSHFLSLTALRVLLVKWPDICRLTFLVQFLFGCIIKSAYLGDIPKVKSWDLGAWTVLQGAI